MSNLTSRLAASESASSTILAKDRTLSCDTRQTGLNNNALVIGPSGAGKTRNVLKPNLLQMNASYIVLDTKGTLCREVGPVLAAHGYRVQCLNFADLNTVPALAPGIERCGYNPLRHIRRKADGRPNQQDILSVAKAICPIEDNNQPFWDHAAANLLSCLIAYVTEQLPADEQTISSVIKLIEHLQDGATARLFDDLITTDPQSYALSLWRRYAITQNAERMHASIVGILAEKVMCLGFDGAAQLYRECHQVDFASMGHTPCALFVTVSDIDRNLDPLTGLFITQAFMGLIREADRQPDGSLPVPVRFMLDDFANLQIPRSTTCSRLSEAATSGQRCCCSRPTSSMRSMARHAHAPSWATATRIWCWRSRIPRVPGCFPTAPTRCPARSWRRRSIARGSLCAATLPNRSSALGSKTIRSTGSCPRRSEAMRRPRSRRRVLAARGAPAMFHKGRAPRDHGKAKGPASDRIRAPDYKTRCVNSSDYLRCAR